MCYFCILVLLDYSIWMTVNTCRVAFREPEIMHNDNYENLLQV